MRPGSIYLADQDLAIELEDDLSHCLEPFYLTKKAGNQILRSRIVLHGISDPANAYVHVSEAHTTHIWIDICVCI